MAQALASRSILFTPVITKRGEAIFHRHPAACVLCHALKGQGSTVGPALDGIAGLGEARRKKLVQALGGVKALKAASLDDLRSLTFLPEAVALAVYERFHDDTTADEATTEPGDATSTGDDASDSGAGD